MLMPAQKLADADAGAAADALHRIVIVGGGAGGLELATKLGDQLGHRGRASVTLIDKVRSHVATSGRWSRLASTTRWAT